MALDVALSATCTRNMLTRDPSPVIDELRRLAGDDHDLLAEVAGRVLGWYEPPETMPLCDALVAEIERAAAWVHLGQERRSAPVHGAPRRAVDRPRYAD
ncbi:hypothetical protein [uncultured Microbacterium sp.]|uniref:hypothetical protein n=1 Tax=uncultured Microbacterium sp. TaxID=191216 RepID=UPI0025D22491|nr:hypothetical protein [uncultured Microbacterium sp.]